MNKQPITRTQFMQNNGLRMVHLVSKPTYYTLYLYSPLNQNQSELTA